MTEGPGDTAPQPEPAAHAWRCDECNEPVARPYYVRDYRFCSEQCRRDFLKELWPNG